MSWLDRINPGSIASVVGNALLSTSAKRLKEHKDPFYPDDGHEFTMVALCNRTGHTLSMSLLLCSTTVIFMNRAVATETIVDKINEDDLPSKGPL